MMELSGVVRTQGVQEWRNWRTKDDHARRRYDKFYFIALSYRCETLDQMVERTSAQEAEGCGMYLKKSSTEICNLAQNAPPTGIPMDALKAIRWRD